jgi:hypothetical protein
MARQAPVRRSNAPSARRSRSSTAATPNRASTSRSLTAVSSFSSWSALRTCSPGVSTEAWRGDRLRRSSVLRRSAPRRRSTTLRCSLETGTRTWRRGTARWSKPLRRSASRRGMAAFGSGGREAPKRLSRSALAQPPRPGALRGGGVAGKCLGEGVERQPTPPRAVADPPQGGCHNERRTGLSHTCSNITCERLVRDARGPAVALPRRHAAGLQHRSARRAVYLSVSLGWHQLCRTMLRCSRRRSKVLRSGGRDITAGSKVAITASGKVHLGRRGHERSDPGR